MLKRRKLVQDFRGKTATREEYDAAFERERAVSYPVIDAFEQRLGYCVGVARLEEAARVLCCPVKRNPPCWQHGRVLYALARDYLRGAGEQDFSFLDIGTAKGFSATVLAWAFQERKPCGFGRSRIVSLDITDPDARVARNTVAEIDSLKTVPELVAPFMPVGANVTFLGTSSLDYLDGLPPEARIHFAFVDGKHDWAHVSKEQQEIAERQKPGDVIVFDDLQFLGVAKAVSRLRGYAVRPIKALPDRVYAVARKQ